MALSSYTKRKLDAAVGQTAMEDLAAQIVSGGNPVATNVALLGETSNLTASAATVATEGTPDCDASEVEAGIEAAVDALAAEVETRLDAIEAKVDSLIGALITAGLMASS